MELRGRARRPAPSKRYWAAASVLLEGLQLVVLNQAKIVVEALQVATLAALYLVSAMVATVSIITELHSNLELHLASPATPTTD